MNKIPHPSSMSAFCIWVLLYSLEGKGPLRKCFSWLTIKSLKSLYQWRYDGSETYKKYQARHQFAKGNNFLTYQFQFGKYNNS